MKVVKKDLITLVDDGRSWERRETKLGHGESYKSRVITFIRRILHVTYYSVKVSLGTEPWGNENSFFEFRSFIGWSGMF